MHPNPPNPPDAPEPSEAVEPVESAADEPAPDDGEDFDAAPFGAFAAGLANPAPAADAEREPEPVAEEPSTGSGPAERVDEAPTVESTEPEVPAPTVPAEPAAQPGPVTPPDSPEPPVEPGPTQPATEPAAVDRRPGPAGVTPTAAAFVVILALAACALLAVVAVRTSQHNGKAADFVAVDHARGRALQAAKTETAATLTYDYRTLDQDFATAEKGLTPVFARNYAQTATTSVAPLARRTHAISTATVAAAGVISATRTTAEILVYADQTVRNSLLKSTSRLDRSVIEVSMVEQNGKWLINNLSPY